jgi:hypothetical protein
MEMIFDIGSISILRQPEYEEIPTLLDPDYHHLDQCFRVAPRVDVTEYKFPHTGWSNSNTLDLDLGGARYKSWRGHWLSHDFSQPFQANAVTVIN